MNMVRHENIYIYLSAVKLYFHLTMNNNNKKDNYDGNYISSSNISSHHFKI